MDISEILSPKFTEFDIGTPLAKVAGGLSGQVTRREPACRLNPGTETSSRYGYSFSSVVILTKTRDRVRVATYALRAIVATSVSLMFGPGDEAWNDWKRGSDELEDP